MRVRSLAWTLALSLLAPVASGSVGGCKAAREAAQGERAPLRARVRVAPVVARDPWVMAFTTHISIEQPEGLDARIEPRKGPAGRVQPEPVIEGERGALADALAAYSEVHTRPPRLVPVYARGWNESGRKLLDRLYFIDAETAIELDAEATAGLREHPEGPLVHIYLGEGQVPRLAEMTEARVGEQIAIVVDEDVVMVPLVMEAIRGGELWVISNRGEDRERESQALFERLTGT